MCFRLLAALQRAPELPAGNSSPSEGEEAAASLQVLERIAFENGLDVRVAPRGPTRYVEVAWGDCACSLYTRRDGRERVVGFVDAVRRAGWSIELLLCVDDQDLDLGSANPDEVSADRFRSEGLAALPEGRVARLV